MGESAPTFAQKQVMKNILLFLIFLSPISLLQAQSYFSKQQVLADMDSLKSTLEQAHYNLYVYTPKSEFELNFQTVKASVKKDSISLLEATSFFQQILSKVNNGHTGIAFPIPSYINYAEQGGTLFPLELAFENEKALIRKNWSGNDQLKVGTEVLSINGLSIAEILAKMYPQISAERLYFKKVKIEAFSFPRYYWQVFGQQATFQVEIADGNGSHIHTVKAISLIEEFEQKREEVLNASRELKFYEKVAYLNPGNFSGNEAQYQQFIDSAFAQIKQTKPKQLIIDLRNNQGGENSFSDYLVSYFAKKPFQWCSHFSMKTSTALKQHARTKADTTKPFWQSVLQHPDGTIYQYPFEKHMPQARSKRFRGKIYVLINRQSHSQAAVTAAQIQDYQLAILVGEETGDYPSLYASIFQYTLPHTGVSLSISKGYMIRVNGSTKAEGVIPDILIKDHLLDEEDEILTGLLERLRVNK